MKNFNKIIKIICNNYQNKLKMKIFIIIIIKIVKIIINKIKKINMLVLIKIFLIKQIIN